MTVLCTAKHQRLIPIEPGARIGRLRLAARWMRFFFRAIGARHYDFASNAMRAEARLLGLTLGDLVCRTASVECNICRWRGRTFYPNTGPGYDELNTLCPGCRGLDRHRALLAVLLARTDCFAPGRRVIEVAPMRGFQALFLAQRDVAYTSFDLERYAMERGDLTAMQYPSDSADYFTCFHVLEHVPNEAKALSEIRRVLKPGGTAIFQVPIDATVEHTYEYEKPDPREVGHVRRYARDFAARLRRHGFDVEAVSATDCCDDDDIRRYGLSRDPIYLATKPVSAIDCPVAAADSCSEVAELTARRV